MKVLKIIGIVLAVLILLAGVAYLISKKSNDSANANVFKAIPADAEFVGVVNLEAFMSLFFTNMGDVWELSEELKDQRNAEEIQKEIQLSGINLSRKVVMFSKNEEFNALVPVKNISDFEAYLEKLVVESNVVSIADNEYFHKDLELFITYNESLCLVSQKTFNDPEFNDPRALWAEILTKSASTDEVSEDYSALQRSENHFSFLVKEDEMAERSHEFKHSPKTLTELTFEDGLIRVNSTMSSTNPDVTNPLGEAGEAFEGSEYMNIHINVDPESGWRYWLSEGAIADLERELNSSELDSMPLNKWKGLLNFSVLGSEKSIEEVITFDYDDNFEMIEKKELKEIDKLSFSGNMSFSEDLSKIDLESVMNSQVHTSIENDMVWFSASEKPHQNTKSAEAPIHISANPKNLIELAMELNVPLAMLGQRFTSLVDHIDLKMIPDGNTINGELIITTPDPNKNSLLHLISEGQKLRF